MAIMAMITTTKILRNANISQRANLRAEGFPVPTGNRHPIDFFHCPRQGAQKADDQSDNTKHQCAGAVVRQDVHQDIKRHYIARHEKNQQQELADSQEFATEAAQQELASISHAVNLGMTELELADDISCVP